MPPPKIIVLVSLEEEHAIQTAEALRAIVELRKTRFKVSCGVLDTSTHSPEPRIVVIGGTQAFVGVEAIREFVSKALANYNATLG